MLYSFVLGLYSGSAVMANPQGAQVMHGQVSFAYPDSHTLNITNSPNSVINWQQFSIQQNEVTRFIQESSSSTVLNRVTGQNPSDILGQLLSNGRVFVINPNGIVFGKDAVVDTAGLVASTLDMTDEDFIAGNLRFEGEKATAIENRGYIKAGEKGEVFLIASNIENSGIIETNGGEILLAAGESVTIASLDSDHIIFEVQAPENEVVNLGQIITRGGAAKMFAGAIKHSGSVNANSISVDKNGNVQLVAKADIEIAKNAMISANGSQGGEIRIESDIGTVWNSGIIEAKGESDTGGHVRLLGERVALFNAAGIDVSGEAGGGEVLVGGDYKGANPDIRNAQKTYVGEETLIRADAATSGDGGKVIIWADETTQAYGKITAKGGAESGDGGFIETSGKQYLEIGEYSPDASATNGEAGTWLLDPENVDITNLQANISQSGSGDPGPINFAPLSNDTTTTVSVGLINSALNNGSNVVVTTNSGGSDPGNITVSSAITKTADGGSANGSTLTLDADNDIDIDASITSTVGVLNLTLDSGGFINIAADIDTNGGLIDAQSMGTGNVTFSGTRIIDSNFNATTLTLVGTNDISFNGTTNTATLNHNAGTLAGTGTVNVSSTWNQSSATTINGNISIGVGIPKTFNGITVFGNGTITSASSLTIASSTNTFDPTLNLAGLSVTGGTLQGSGDITVSTSMIFDNGGTIGGSGTITTQAGSTTSLGNGNNAILADSRVWENFGTVNFLAPTGFTRFHLQDTSQFINRSTGVFNFDVDDDNGTVILNTGTFTNEGTFNNTGVEIGRIQSTFNNTGTVNVQNNRLEIEAGGTDTGDYTVASGTVLAFDSGTRNFNSGVDFSGLGTVQFDGATANLNSGTTFTASGLSATNGTVTFDTVGGAATINLSSLSVTGGTLQGPDNFVVSTGMSLTNGGTIGGSGTITTQAGSTTTLANGNNGILADSRVWENFGTVNFLAPTGFTRFHLNGTSQFINRSTGVFNFDVDEDNGTAILGAATGRFTNEGTFNNTGVEIGRIQTIVFDNDGTVAVQNNRLEIEVGGTDTGDYTVASGTVLAFDSGTRNFNSGVDFSGLGTVQFDGATANLNSGTTFTASGLSATNGTVTFDTVGGAATINLSSLSVTGGTLQGPDNFVVSTGMSLTNGGTIGGSGTITTQAGSTTTLANGNNGILADSRVWENFGTVNFLAPTGFTRFHLNGTSQFINRSTGVFNFDVDEDNGTAILGAATGRFTNEGTFNNTGVEIGRIQTIVFDNDGTVAVQNNRLEIEVGGTDTGDYTVASGTVLAFDSGTRNFNSGVDFSGLGTVQFDGATANLNSGTTFTASGLSATNGTVTFDTVGGAATINLSSLSVTGGTLQGPDNFVVSTGMSLTNGGTIGGSGTITTQAGSTTTLANGNNGILADSRVWENFGTVNFLAPTGFTRFHLQDTSQFINRSTGVFNFDVDDDNGTVILNTGTFTNEGTFNNTGVEIGRIQSTFNNTGTVNVQNNRLEIEAGGTDTGDYTVASGTVLAFDSGTRNFNSGVDFSGLGTVQFDGATANLNSGTTFTASGLSATNGTVTFDTVGGAATINLSSLSVTGGTLQGPDNFVVSTGMSLTNGGTIGGSGTITTQAGSTTTLANGNNGILADSRVWENFGTVNFLAPTGFTRFHLQDTSQFINRSTGVFNFDVDDDNGTVILNTGTFTNEGTFNNTGVEIGRIQSTFNNTGTVNVQNNRLEIEAGGTDTGDYTVASGTVLAFDAGTRNLNAPGSISGLGTVILAGADLNVNNTSSISNFTHSSGILGGSGSLTVNNTWTPTSGITIDGTLITPKCSDYHRQFHDQW